MRPSGLRILIAPMRYQGRSKGFRPGPLLEGSQAIDRPSPFPPPFNWSMIE
jgi:hypothetical protein